MKTSDFMYDLPEELIAQTPIEPRDHSRLLVYHRDTKQVEHKHFYDVIDYLNPGDALIINDTRVIPARLYGTRAGGGACELLLLKQLGSKRWESLVRPGAKLKPGKTISIAATPVPHVEVLEIAKKILAEKNITLDIITVTDYVTPNTMVDAGDVYANYFAHEPYQTNFNAENGTNVVIVAGIHVEPMALYGGKQADLSALTK